MTGLRYPLLVLTFASSPLIPKMSHPLSLPVYLSSPHYFRLTSCTQIPICCSNYQKYASSPLFVFPLDFWRHENCIPQWWYPYFEPLTRYTRLYSPITCCAGTGRPHHSRKVSLTRFLDYLNYHIQMYFFSMAELTELPILHLLDTYSSYSEFVFLPSREFPDFIPALKRRWFHVHGNQTHLRMFVEFSHSKAFADFLRYFFVTSEPWETRLHNKNGSVEDKHGVIRRLILRLLNDLSVSNNNITGPSLDINFPTNQSHPSCPPSSGDVFVADLHSRAWLLSNGLYCVKPLSAI